MISKKNYLRGTIKFTNFSFAILEKSENSLDYQKKKESHIWGTFREEKEIINAFLLNLSNKSLNVDGLYELAHQNSCYCLI